MSKKGEKMKPQASDPISRERAIEIARESCIPRLNQFVCKDEKPDNCQIYNMPSEPCWFVHPPLMDMRSGLLLGSRRVIIVSKLTGKILYDGLTNDEG